MSTPEKRTYSSAKREFAENIQGTLAPEDMPGSLLTSWVLVTEWFDPADGQKFLAADVSKHTPWWLVRGMLDEGKDMLSEAIEPQDD